jgi:hypothetical protein
MTQNKIIAGLRDVLDGNIARVTFYVDDLSLGAVDCPECDAPHTWSHPDLPPAFCVGCGVEFLVYRKRR